MNQFCKETSDSPAIDRTETSMDSKASHNIVEDEEGFMFSKAEIKVAMSATSLVTRIEDVLGHDTSEKDRDDFNSWYYQKINVVKHHKEPFNPPECLVQQLEQKTEHDNEQYQSFSSQHEPDSAPVTAGQSSQACQAGLDGQAGQDGQAWQSGHAGDVDTLGLGKNIQLGVVSLEIIIVLILTAILLFNKSKTLQFSHKSAFNAFKAAHSPPPPKSSLNKGFSTLSARLWKFCGSFMNIGTSEEAKPLVNVNWLWADKNLLRDSSWY